MAASAATAITPLFASSALHAEEKAAAMSGQPFSFDKLTEDMRLKAGQDYSPLEKVGGYLGDLTYDAYKLIRYNSEKALFSHIKNNSFRLHAFHMGWLFRSPVTLYEVSDGEATPVMFNTDDFIYEREARELVPAHEQLPGIAGFRLHYPLNRPDIFDELLAFQGASYFRALGRGSIYGLSARGLAINTGGSEPEEFPVFTRFYVEKPTAGAETVTVYAALESESLTGAYRFVVKPGENTVMETTARLFLRADIPQLGIAPLTSMFLFAERNRDKFDDFRPQVHDSEGLVIKTREGEHIWRPLSNPPHLASSYFEVNSLEDFGLYQRDRDFENYQDTMAHYERRPSLKVEPVGDWGKGKVRLVEIPTDLEVNDNIVAFWLPENGGKAGQTFEFTYRLHWGDLPPEADGDLAYVHETRAGSGGVSGVSNEDGSRKFVIDFKDGIAAGLPTSALEDGLKAKAHVENGKIISQTLIPIPDEGVWRLVLDVSAEPEAIVEMNAHLAGFGRRLSETWIYQWINK
ncbi:glucan biosynthesis protein [Cohaesibacter sp. ES.047]|uniref:glucan biosynthesis protein n=1 Tax=Cohaesibacter sp. ES.047 TaxID=1798205 RepID=UPI001FCEB480|nr:glucan biosynthesis protein G [Cohaesibacter sp. ES.047]